MAKNKRSEYDIEIVNRKAAFEFQFIEMVEAGIMLQGTEMKSIRKGNVNLKDSFCRMQDDELYVHSLYIKEYELGTDANHETRRTRKLLLRKQELKKLSKKVKEKGFTIVPYRMYVTDRGFAKLEIALAQGKNTYDKRDSLKNKDQKRDLDRMKKIRL